ncbi:hypothetical protein K438DRAFT_347602 [Mycena galopus ATCC 62051]|nr:hypothetical protein K438DRAFT_347602 [Mycena galopus ATCC 62051]
MPFRAIILTPVMLLQSDPFPPDLGLNVSSLRLRMRDDAYMNFRFAQIVQDYTHTSVLDGLATFSGFWTFVNGAFVLFFGANLLYFLFRRRPLSALGVVHIFQRRTLTRKWNEDFPALQMEGGRPGSKSAGIISFLRERLVDLDDEESLEDIEAQNHPSSEPAYHPVEVTDKADAGDTLKETHTKQSDGGALTA